MSAISPSFSALLSVAAVAAPQSLSLPAADHGNSSVARIQPRFGTHAHSGHQVSGVALTGMSILQRQSAPPTSGAATPSHTMLLTTPSKSQHELRPYSGSGSENSGDDTSEVRSVSASSSSSTAMTVEEAALAAHGGQTGDAAQQLALFLSPSSNSSSPPLHPRVFGSSSPTISASSSPLHRPSSTTPSYTGSPMLKSSNRRNSHASLSLSNSNVSFRPTKKGVPTSLSSGSASSSSDSAGGSSCHQCKSRRQYGDLTYCTSSLRKKNKNAVCRKKYCEHCLKKFYRESAAPAGTAGCNVWKCPSCRKICCCAACRRREMRENGIIIPAPDESGGPVLSNLSLVALAAASSSAQLHNNSLGEDDDEDDMESDGEDARMSPREQEPSPSSASPLHARFERSPSPINMDGLLMNIPPLSYHEGSSVLSNADVHHQQSSSSPKLEPLASSPRTLLSIHHSPALTALSHAASQLMREEGLTSTSLSSSSAVFSPALHQSILKPATANGHDLLGLGLNRAGGNQLGMSINGAPAASSSSSASDEADESSDDDAGDTASEAHALHRRNGYGRSTRARLLSRETLFSRGRSTSTLPSPSFSPSPSSSFASPSLLPVGMLGSTTSSTTSLSLMLALSQLPIVHSNVQAIMKNTTLSNADKLLQIDAMITQAAVSVQKEELQLQL